MKDTIKLDLLRYEKTFRVVAVSSFCINQTERKDRVSDANVKSYKFDLFAFLSVRELHDNDLELIGPKVFYNIPELLHL